MDVHLRSAFHPLLGRVRIGASRVRPLSPELHTSNYSVACPGSSTWVNKVPSRDTPTLNLAGHRGVWPSVHLRSHETNPAHDGLDRRSPPLPRIVAHRRRRSGW